MVGLESSSHMELQHTALDCNSALQVESLSAEMHQRVPELKALQQAIQERQKKMAGLEKTINDVKDSIYATLSKQVRRPVFDCCA